MTQAQATRRLAIIIEYAVEFLAEKHNTTTAKITEAIKAGNKKVNEQFEKLVETGIKTAAAM